jgi:hypothetical protein
VSPHSIPVAYGCSRSDNALAKDSPTDSRVGNPASEDEAMDETVSVPMVKGVDLSSGVSAEGAYRR